MKILSITVPPKSTHETIHCELLSLEVTTTRIEERRTGNEEQGTSTGNEKMKMETKRRMDNEVTYSTQVLFIYQIPELVSR